MREEQLKCPPITIEETSFTPHCRHAAYAQGGVEIDLVVSGSGVHNVLNMDIPCKAGDVYVINAGIPHCFFAAENGADMIVRRLAFDPDFWFDGKAAVPDSADFCLGIFRDSPMTACATLNSEMLTSTLSAFDAIDVEANEQNESWMCAVKARLTLLIISLARYVNEAIKELSSPPGKDLALVKAVIAEVENNLSETALTLEVIAEKLFVSSSHLSRLFKNHVGSGFSEYLRKARVDHACHLLKDTDLTVGKIIEHCGLKDVSSFYKVFAAQTGMTPNVYRTQEKNKNLNILKGNKFMITLSEISIQLQAGKAKAVKEMVQQAIDEGIPAETILKEGLVPGMNVIGEKFKNNEVFVPEVLVAARAMNQGASLLKPLLVKEGVPAAGRVCIGTVHGDLHDIGKNIVKMMLEGKGFEVVDLGTDVPADTFVNTAVEQNCDIICCSALLTTTMGVMADVVKAAEAAGIRNKVKIMIGGAPVSQEFCDQIGADAYTSDAASCADLALELCK